MNDSKVDLFSQLTLFFSFHLGLTVRQDYFTHFENRF